MTPQPKLIFNLRAATVATLLSATVACQGPPPPPTQPATTPRPPAVQPAPPQAAPKAIDEAALKQAQEALTLGLKQWRDGDQTQARASFLLATKKDPSLAQAHIGLAIASLRLTQNTQGASQAATQGLQLAQDPAHRAQALATLAMSVQGASIGPYSATALADYAQRNDPSLQAIQALDPTLIKALGLKPKPPAPTTVAQCQRPTAQLEPVNTVEEACDAIAKLIKAEQGHSPGPCRVELKPFSGDPLKTQEAQVVSFDLEGEREYWALVRPAKQWFGVALLKAGHATDGHIHESVTFDPGQINPLPASASWLNLRFTHKRGAEDEALGTFYRAEQITTLRCHGATPSACTLEVERAHTELLLTKLTTQGQTQRYVTAFERSATLDVQSCLDGAPR